MKTMPERIMALINIGLYRFPNILIANIIVKNAKAFYSVLKQRTFG